MNHAVTLLGGLLLTAFFAVHAAAAPKSTDKPNIVIILADDLGYGDVQALNPQRGKITTPHLDRLSAQGMTFTDAHSGSSVCTPTRYGLLTGRYAWRTRLQSGVLDGGNDEPLIAVDRLTLAGLLKQHGYATACIGKWHLGFQSDAATNREGKKTGRSGLPVGAKIIGGPTTRGFDLFWGCSNARTMSSLVEGDCVIESMETIDMLPRLGKRAVSFIAEKAGAAKAGSPFLLYLPLTSPHTPLVPAPEWQGKSGLGAYGDFVMQTDAVVGDVLAALDHKGLSDNTLVIFTADNGCSHQAGTDKLEKAGHFASERYRGYKADIWEGGHRVPFFVRWPGQVKPGSQSGRLLCLVDLMATCADILSARLPVTAAEDSVSFLPALVGSGSKPLREAVVHHSIHGKFAIRQGRWKLCLCAGSGGWSQGETDLQQLYDLTDDPGETTNLAQQQPEVIASMSALLMQCISQGRSTPGAALKNDVAVSSPFEDTPVKKREARR